MLLGVEPDHEPIRTGSLMRLKLTAEEAKKARLIFETDIDGKVKELAYLHVVLKEREIKLAEAQKTQVDLLRKPDRLIRKKHSPSVGTWILDAPEKPMV